MKTTKENSYLIQDMDLILFYYLSDRILIRFLMKERRVRKIVIVGATSGIGRSLALGYLSRGEIVGVTGRRTESLEEIKALYPGSAFYRTMDVQDDGCLDAMGELIGEMGGMDVMVYCAGAGTQNPALDMEVEMNAVRTNVDGFMRAVIYSFNYFKERRSGQIVDISSLSAVRPVRHSPAYGSTKRYQAHYMSCLAWKSNHDRLGIKMTTIFPGWIKTDMLKYDYPIVISLEKGTRIIMRAIDRKRRKAMVPWWWSIAAGAWKLIPNFIYERL